MARSPTEAPGTTEPSEPRVKIALAWLASAWEAAWRAAWPVATVLGAFLVLAGFDLLPDLPGWLHALILVAFAAALVLASRPLWRLRLPDGLAARRRLERDSGLEHRPLTGLRDTQATGTADPLSRVLWQRHLAQRAAQLRLLKPRLPRPRNSEADRYALRGLVVIGLVLAVVAAGDDWRGRLGRAVSPGLFGAAAATAPRLDLFVTPPAYTGRPPIYLTAGQMAAPAAGQPAPGPVEIPTGSALVGRVAGGDEAPILGLAGGDTAFTPIEGGNYELQAKITGGDRLSVSQDGTVLGDWAVKVLPDAPPTVSFTDKPKPTERQALRIDATAGDDYGIATLTATVTLAPGAPAVLDPAPLTITLSVPGRWPRELKTTSYQDLTPHAWAGQAVDIVLTATDAAGQSTKSAPERVALPEREFHHPVARAIIEQRRTLTLQPDQSETVAETLDMLSQRPDRYYDDKVVFLALRTAARRLFFAEDAKPHIAALRDLLWDTALRIEDGDMSLAERSLRDAQQRLADALERNASDEEIKQLTDELRRAMDRYLQAMSEQMRQKMERGELTETPLPPDAQIMDQKQFQDMIDKMQQLSESGAKDEARQLLSQMQNMMENLRMGQMSQEQAQAQQRAMNLLKDLQKLTNAQRQLLDQTFRQQQAQQGEEGDPSQQQPQDGTPEQNAQTQEALRRALGEMMRELGDMGGDIPMPLGRAERAMKQSGESLAQGDPSGSVPSQTEALDQLQQGLQGLAQQMMESMAMQPGMTGPGQQGRQQGNRDPLGRSLDDREGGQGTTQSDSGTKVPTQFDTERARAILDELRQRLNGRSSSPQERDYIQRLLRQF